MICPHCGTPNPEHSFRCVSCSLALPDARPTIDTPGTSPGSLTESDPRSLTGSIALPSSIDPTGGAPGGITRRGPGATQPAPSGEMLTLPSGFELGRRYSIVKLVGRGGMGAVYRARDRELSRDVAVKVIRSDIADNPHALERFKREIQLASQVTHRNVMRVYDLGESADLKFVTMQLIEGEDLAQLIRREGRLPLPRLISIFRQICQGLGAAHEQGVIHRDLKPQNIMIDRGDGVYVTDFGLAKTLGETGLTEAGTLLGTPHYMSPEQVRAEPVDHRTDIYSLGVIFYEMATGTPPFSGGSAFEVMMQRLQRAPRPVGEVNPDLPPYLRGILDRCLATDPNRRYQSLNEVLADLDEQHSRPLLPAPAPPRPRRTWLLAGVVLASLATAAGLLAWRFWTPSVVVPASGQSVSVLIADFENRTGDPVLDSTLEPALGVALEGAPFINTYSRSAARRLAVQLQPGATRLDESLARLVASREGVSFVATGAVEGHGAGYRITVRTIDAIKGTKVSETSADVEGKQEVLPTVTRLAARVRKALGDATPESAQMAAAETFTAASLDAAHAYALGQEAQWAGDWDEAIRHYTQAVEQDPNLGRAYAGMAAVEHNRGRVQDAERYYRLALARIERMSEREKYRTRGGYYLAVGHDPDNAVEELSALVSKYPADSAGLANLAVAYHLRRDFARALEEGRRAVALSPKNVIQRNNVGLFAMYAGDFDAAVREQQEVLALNPKFVSGHAGLALAQFGAGRVDEARETWKKLQGLGAEGASVAALGLADLALYEGKAADARSLLGPAIDADIEQGERERAAVKLTLMAEALLLDGQRAAAAAAAERAVGLGKTPPVTVGAARVLMAAGQPGRAAAVAAELGKGLDPESKMWVRLIRGEAELARGASREALDSFKEAQKLLDSWVVRYDLGRAYVDAGAFAEAHGQLELCLKRRGEAADLFLSLIPSWRATAPVHYYLGRAHEGLGSPESAATAFRTFLEIKHDGRDPLVADARRRIEAGPTRASTAP